MTMGAGDSHGVNAFDLVVQALFALEDYPTCIASEFTAQLLSAQQLLTSAFLAWLERLEQDRIISSVGTVLAPSLRLKSYDILKQSR